MRLGGRSGKNIRKINKIIGRLGWGERKFNENKKWDQG